MTNVSAWIKILVATALVATILLSLGSKNGSTTGLKGSRRLQDLSAFITPFNRSTTTAASGPRFTNFINFSVFPQPPVAPSPTNTSTPVAPSPTNSTSNTTSTPVPTPPTNSTSNTTSTPVPAPPTNSTSDTPITPAPAPLNPAGDFFFNFNNFPAVAPSGPRFTNFINFGAFPQQPVAPSPATTSAPVAPLPTNSTSTNMTTPVTPLPTNTTSTNMTNPVTPVPTNTTSTNTTTPVTPLPTNSTSTNMTNMTSPFAPPPFASGFTNEGASAQVVATLQGLSQTSGGGLLPDFNTVQSSFFGTPGGFSNDFFP